MAQTLENYIYNPYEPGAQFYSYIDITPGKDAPDGSIFYISIDKGSHISGS